ncbi:MAG: helix-turn-helix transcriptional regulator [Lachnospiraceae bacterium]|nr:helix-turn-helix transcriptional regulator [Lachnospiraceae bacterium]
MIKAIRGGYETRHPIGYRMYRPNGLPHHALLIIRSHGEYDLNGVSHVAEPGYALLLAPNTPNHYGNPNGNYVDDWLHFSIDGCPMKEELDSISNVPFPIGNIDLYTFCIRQILWELSYGSPDYADANINALFQLLLNHLLMAYQVRNSGNTLLPHYNELQQIRMDVMNSFSNPHSIQEISCKLKISESYFQYLYKKLFGVTFLHDLIQARITHANYLLLTTSLPINQIAELCGYTNEVHFYRQFKKIIGTSPAKYRKSANA